MVIPAWYRMGYQTRDVTSMPYTEALVASIRELHAMVGNAVTEGRYIAFGTGSTQLINAVIHSLALQDPGRVTPVVSKAPYYNVSKHSPVSHDDTSYKQYLASTNFRRLFARLLKTQFVYPI